MAEDSITASPEALAPPLPFPGGLPESRRVRKQSRTVIVERRALLNQAAEQTTVSATPQQLSARPNPGIIWWLRHLRIWSITIVADLIVEMRKEILKALALLILGALGIYGFVGIPDDKSSPAPTAATGTGQPTSKFTWDPTIKRTGEQLSKRK